VGVTATCSLGGKSWTVYATFFLRAVRSLGRGKREDWRQPWAADSQKEASRQLATVQCGKGEKKSCRSQVAGTYHYLLFLEGGKRFPSLGEASVIIWKGDKK